MTMTTTAAASGRPARTIDDYVDAARARIGATSDRQLATRMGLKSSAIPCWRTRRTWPRDDTMLQLAELAGMPAEQALLDLGMWRTEGRTAEVYRRIAERLARTAAALLPFAVAAYTVAGTEKVQSNIVNCMLYIMSNYVFIRSSRGFPSRFIVLTWIRSRHSPQFATRPGGSF